MLIIFLTQMNHNEHDPAKLEQDVDSISQSLVCHLPPLIHL